jgi:N-acetyl-gamma-glutamylphosphate reductase
MAFGGKALVEHLQAVAATPSMHEQFIAIVDYEARPHTHQFTLSDTCDICFTTRKEIMERYRPTKEYDI